MEVIKLTNIEKYIKDRQLFQIKGQSVNQGDKIGLIGKNGVGKSSLLKILAGLDQDFKGQVELLQTFAYVPQIKSKTMESGGEQMKRLLFEALNQHPEVLILDEPSSHLDQTNIRWLIKILKKFPGTLLLVSHDRVLLNEVTNQIWELDDGKLTTYAGNFNDYEQTKEVELARQEIAYNEYRKKVQQLEIEAQKRTQRAQNFKRQKRNISRSDYKVNSFAGRYDAQQKSMAKSAKALEKRVEQLEEVDRPKKEHSFIIKAVGHTDSLSDETLLHFSSSQVKTGERLLFVYDSFKITAGEKISINGPNQAGKTTFLKNILEHHLPGYYRNDLAIGYFSQDFSQLDLNASVFDNVMKTSLQSEAVVLNVLASLGFNHSKVTDMVDHLSGGERVRLQLAKILLGDYHLLILDEPTNFLDLQTLKIVESFIQNHPGAIILVSHDQTFVENTAEKHFYIEDNKLVSEIYLGDNQDQLERKIDLLTFQLEQMIADEEISLEDIQRIQAEIQTLKSRNGLQ